MCGATQCHETLTVRSVAISMTTASITYPIDEGVQEALGRFKGIASRLHLGKRLRSEREVVRLLGNTHYDRIERSLACLNSLLPVAGPIGTRVLQASDPIQLEQAFAELKLFDCLRGALGDGVQPTRSADGAKSNDIDVGWKGRTVRIEVFSPVDFVGSQRFGELLRLTLRYLDLRRGYELEVSLEVAADPIKVATDLFWAYGVPDGKALAEWRAAFAQDVTAWLSDASAGNQRDFPGPGNAVTIKILVGAIGDESFGREICIQHAGKSTDTRLYFESGTEEDTAARRGVHGSGGSSPKPSVDHTRRGACGVWFSILR